MARTEYEQLEYQRRNPHLFTTLSQCVNADGSITTYQQVTQKLQEAYDTAQTHHTKLFGGEHPVMCMRPVMGVKQNNVCVMVGMLQGDMDRCRVSFVENYKYMADKLAPNQPTKANKE